MERIFLRCGIVMLVAVVLFPAVSMAADLRPPRPERPALAAAPWGEEGMGRVARLLALLREMLGDWGNDDTRTDGHAEKELENRAGIDPNGNS